MATLTVRRLDDKVYAKLGERAKRNNRSLEAEVRTMLEAQTFDCRFAGVSQTNTTSSFTR
jgi:plasmid stability protein